MTHQKSMLYTYPSSSRSSWQSYGKAFPSIFRRDIRTEIQPPQETASSYHLDQPRRKSTPNPSSPSLVLLPLLKNQLQLRQCHRKAILALVPQRRTVLPVRKPHVKLQQQPRDHGAQLHVSELFADTTERAGQEGEEGCLVEDEFGLGIPAFGDEGVGLGEGERGCEEGGISMVE